MVQGQKNKKNPPSFVQYFPKRYFLFEEIHTYLVPNLLKTIWEDLPCLAYFEDDVM